MRRCDATQLAVKPFASDDVVLLVTQDKIARKVTMGGGGRMDRRAVLTLYLPPDLHLPVGETVTVNVLPATHRLARQSHDGTAATAALAYEAGEAMEPPRVAEARLAFDCRVIATGTVAGLADHPHMVVAQVLAAYQRWPRGCAI
jgi:hypothetical protein